jgi:hypothetical protein
MTSYLSIASLNINTSDVTNHRGSCQQCLLHKVVSWFYRIDVVPFHSLNAFEQVLEEACNDSTLVNLVNPL